MQRHLTTIAAVLCTLACVSGPVRAQERHGEPGREGMGMHEQHGSERGNMQERRGPERGDLRAPLQPGLNFDQRYNHNHYYPSHGARMPRLPDNSYRVNGGRYFYNGGVWFQPFGDQFEVIVPPLGAVVPFLPPSYVTLWLSGAPYYYANGTYYAPAPAQQGYVVVAPPPGS